jgi:hypothetical protein
MRGYGRREYSFDASVRTFDADGNVENGEFFIQIKSTDHLKYSPKYKGYELKLEYRDLDLWLNEISPVLIVLYDAKKSRGFYLDIQDYFNSRRDLLKTIGDTKAVYLHPSSRLTPSVIEKYKIIKNEREKILKGL